MSRGLPDIPSPCIGVCRLDPESQLCVGCYRSAHEVAEWTTAGNERRMEIVAELKTRRRAAGIGRAAEGRPRRRGRGAPA